MIENLTIPFNELLINQKEPTQREFIEINDKKIMIKQYISINDKLKLISNVLNELVADNKYNFVNPVKIEVYKTIEIIKFYTNITIPEDEETPDVYDALIKEGIVDVVFESIPADEYAFVSEGIENTIDSYYNYKNSILGILESISEDYSNLKFETNDIQEKLQNTENLSLLKDVVTKLG